jgi:hypothetical protein
MEYYGDLVGKEKSLALLDVGTHRLRRSPSTTSHNLLDGNALEHGACRGSMTQRMWHVVCSEAEFAQGLLEDRPVATWG